MLNAWLMKHNNSVKQSCTTELTQYRIPALQSLRPLQYAEIGAISGSAQGNLITYIVFNHVLILWMTE